MSTTKARSRKKQTAHPVRNGYARTSNGAVADARTIETTELPISKIRPNDYNPNRMTDEQFAELVAEVRHLGRLPKPVVVRQDGDGYQVIDGEHSLRAAKEASLVQITCEVIQADDFEAMRQTYKRNQHGTHHPVLQGRMFRRMRELQGISNREMAKELGRRPERFGVSVRLARRNR